MGDTPAEAVVLCGFVGAVQLGSFLPQHVDFPFRRFSMGEGGGGGSGVGSPTLNIVS